MPFVYCKFEKYYFVIYVLVPEKAKCEQQKKAVLTINIMQ